LSSPDANRDPAAPSRVVVQFLKWTETPHWQFEMDRIGEDHHGTWLGARAGDAARKGHEAPTRFQHDFVKLITPDRWWTAIWNSGGKYALYVDIATPVIWNGATATMLDIDLDVLVLREGGLEIHDEDEFEEHRTALAYPEWLVAGARATTAEVVVAIEAGLEPFGTAGLDVLQRWVDSGRA